MPVGVAGYLADVGVEALVDLSEPVTAYVDSGERRGDVYLSLS